MENLHQSVDFSIHFFLCQRWKALDDFLSDSTGPLRYSNQTIYGCQWRTKGSNLAILTDRQFLKGWRHRDLKVDRLFCCWCFLLFVLLSAREAFQKRDDPPCLLDNWRWFDNHWQSFSRWSLLIILDVAQQQYPTSFFDSLRCWSIISLSLYTHYMYSLLYTVYRVNDVVMKWPMYSRRVQSSFRCGWHWKK